MRFLQSVCLLMVGIFPPVLGFSAAPQDDPQIRHESGRKIYNFRCYFCHGYSGNAKTLAATYLSPPPVNFTRSQPDTLTLPRMIASITQGKKGTAMSGFESVLNQEEIRDVATFIREEFIIQKAPNTRYHIPENGWLNHDRYVDAYPFATGQIPLDRNEARLTPQEIRGKALFLSTCITCHDRATVQNEGPIWEPRAVSFPRNQYSHRPMALDGISGATPFAQHDRPPQSADLTSEEQLGENIYQKNCAFCHAADGTGRNWIGTFMTPHPRDFTSNLFMAHMSRNRLKERIQNGLPGTSMPAWKSVLQEAEIQAVISYMFKVFYPLPVKPESARSAP